MGVLYPLDSKRSRDKVVEMIGAGLIVLLAMAAQSVPPAGVSADAAAGKVLFEGRGRCLTCHVVDERGTRKSRDLSWIGLLRTPDSLRRSVANLSQHPDA